MERSDISHQVEDPNFDRKLDLITACAHPYIKEHLLTRITKQNCITIVTYILAFMTEVNPSIEHRVITIYKLKLLAEYYHPKSFEELTRQDILDYLDGIRKAESVDPLHKWIGTYNHTRVIFQRFFRWLYRPSDDIKPNKRSIPAVMQQIPNIKRHEVSIYKPTDLWTEEDDALFYKYCPSVRDRCWHAVSRDTGCRPSELLRLKIKDVVVQQLENGYQVARITVNGKTGTRHVRLNNSYPRLKDWLRQGHPYPGNPSAPLFCGLGKKNTGKKLARNTMFSIYNNYKKVHFPHLLKDPTVPEEDKRKIAELLKKPWNPYIRRHTAATEISKALNDSVLIDQYMGWSHAGNTRQKYQHYYNDDSFDAMLTMMDGLKPLAPAKGKLILKPRLCPNCQESNTPESRFCSKCKFVLSFDAYNETITDAERAKEEQQRKLQEMEKKLNFMYEALQATKILKDIDNEQKKLLAESPKMQKIAKEIQEEEEQELREDLEEGLKQEQEGK
jgi:integrase